MPKGRKKAASLCLTRANAGDSFMARIPRGQTAFTCALVWTIRASAKPLPKSNKISATLLWSLSYVGGVNRLYNLTNGTRATKDPLSDSVVFESGEDSSVWQLS